MLHQGEVKRAVKEESYIIQNVGYISMSIPICVGSDSFDHTFECEILKHEPRNIILSRCHQQSVNE